MRGFGVIIDWRLDGINRNFQQIYERYIKPYKKTAKGAFPMSLTVCFCHIDDYTKESRDKIKKDQEKCPDYPKPNFFLDGYCYHYRPGTGHCDLLKSEKDGNEDKS